MVYRISFSTAVLFAVCAAISHVRPRFHDSHWGSKFFWWVVMILITCVVPNSFFFGYVWAARFGAFAFVVLQQVLLIDLAYYVNDALVEMADNSEEYAEIGGLSTPLVGLLLLSFLFFALSVTGISLLFVYFGTGCESPNVIMSLTIILIIVATLCQLFSQDSNLLTSSVVALYATYLAAAALSANPVARCNPFYANSNDWMSIVLGIAFTVIALCYTIYSASRNIKYLKDGRGTKTSDDAPGGALMNRVLTGQLPENQYQSDETVAPSAEQSAADVEGQATETVAYEEKAGSEVASFNIVMCLMAMNVAMTLTNWGSTNRSGAATNPQSGKIAMWMQAASQWVALLLYIWCLIAPRLFPDRDFS